MQKSRSGFTLVELLITIVVIAILAAISVVAYNGIQQRARETVRQNDMALIAKALELYYTEHGRYPTVTNGSPCVNENGVARSGCANWNELASHLKTYTGTDKLPLDPINKLGSTATTHTYFYWPIANNSQLGCASSQPYQSYYLVYFPENPSKFQNNYNGTCAQSKKPTPYYGTARARAHYQTHS